MTDDMKLRDELAKDIAQFCWCAGGACSGCEENSMKLFKKGWDAKAKREDERVRRLVDRMRELGQAMPPNAVSMEIQKALKEFDK